MYTPVKEPSYRDKCIEYAFREVVKQYRDFRANRDAMEAAVLMKRIEGLMYHLMKFTDEYLDRETTISVT